MNTKSTLSLHKKAAIVSYFHNLVLYWLFW